MVINNEDNCMLIRKLILLVLCTTFVYASYGSAQVTRVNDITIETIRSAIVAGQERKFSEAFSILDQTPSDKRNGYEYSYAKARLLSWSGQYSAAEAAYDKLSEEYPENVDIVVSRGFFELFRGNPAAAKDHFHKVALQYPSYNDAKIGLERAEFLLNSGPDG